MKAVIRHLPGDTPAKDISDELLTLGFTAISARHMTATRPKSEGDLAAYNIPVFLVTLTRNKKASEIFKLTNLGHVIVRVEAYKAQSEMTQDLNCKRFGHIRVNCKQPPRCMWCGGGHLHRGCPEKTKENSTLRCCSCTLAEGGKPHPSNYRGCSRAKEETLRRRAERAPTKKTPIGRVFSSRYATPALSFAAAAA